MPVVPVDNMEGEQVGELALRDDVFGVPVNPGLLHQAVLMHLANRRQGTHSTKTRGEVSGGGRKPWRQKGTGRARHGSIRSPLWRHGGVVFGPKPREYGWTMPQKQRRLALKQALSSKVGDGDLVVVERLSLAEPKTRVMAAVLRKLDAQRKPLIVMAEKDEKVILAARNIPGVQLLPANALSVYSVLNSGKLVMTRDAVKQLEEALA